MADADQVIFDDFTSIDAKVQSKLDYMKLSLELMMQKGPELDPDSPEGMAWKLQSYIEKMDPNDLRLGFMTTQRDILVGIAYKRDQEKWNADDRKWIQGVVKDFMNPLFSALDGNPNERWRDTFSDIAEMQRQNKVMMENSPEESGLAVATNYALAGRMMAMTHINSDLRNSLANNGIGTDANWATIGKIVSDASVNVYGPGLGHIGSFIVGNVRDQMRNDLKKQGAPIYGPIPPPR
jgi:hypothetical protein